MSLIVKAFLERPSGSVEVRRVQLKTDFTFAQLKEKVASAFPALEAESFEVTWQDQEGDFVLMSSDEELREAIESFKGQRFKVYITPVEVGEFTIAGQSRDEGEKEKVIEESLDGGEKTTVTQLSEGREETCIGDPLEDGEKTIIGQLEEGGDKQQESDQTLPQQRPRVAFAKFPQGHRAWLRGAGPVSRNVRMSGPNERPFRPTHPFSMTSASFPFLAMRRQNERPLRPGQPLDTAREASGPSIGVRVPGASTSLGGRSRPGLCTRGSSIRRGGMGLSAFEGMEGMRPAARHGPMLHRKGLFGHFQDPEGVRGPMRRFGAGNRVEGMRAVDQGGAISDMKARKAALREKVPVQHRRWAKAYIQQWRKQNVENATSSSSDEGADVKITMGRANVPESYAKWLDVVLPRFHQRWSVERPKISGGEDGKEQLKREVPQEFRSWCVMYINRRFAPKTEPGFIRGPEGIIHLRPDKVFGASDEQSEDFPPLEQRIWTKLFIKEWHQEHAMDGGSFPESSSGESDEEKQTISEDIEIPKDYPRWLNVVLPFVYNKCGVTVNTPTPDGQELKERINEFKTTVPFGYRKWVKTFVRRILNGESTTEEVRGKPSKVMHPFMRMQKHGRPTSMLRKPGRKFVNESDATYTTSSQIEPQTADSQAKASTHNSQDQRTEDFAELQQEPNRDGDSDEDVEIPQQVLEWMSSSMTEDQLQRMMSQIREQQRIARFGPRAARPSARSGRKPFQFRYV